MDGNGYFFGPESFQRESPPGQSANFRPSAWLCCFPLPWVSSCLMLLSYGADGAAWALGHRADAPKKMTLTVAWSIHVGSFIVHSLFALFHNVSYVSVPGCCQVALGELWKPSQCKLPRCQVPQDRMDRRETKQKDHIKIDRPCLTYVTYVTYVQNSSAHFHNMHISRYITPSNLWTKSTRVFQLTWHQRDQRV